MKLIRKMNAALALAAVVACVRCAFAADPGGPAIAAPQALRLLDLIVPGAAAFEATATDLDGHVGYRVAGAIGNDRYECLVDAIVPRVLTVGKNGAEQYKWPGIFAVAHRGAMRFAPENTISAYKKAVELGAHCIEMDVRESKDGHFVIMHDPSVFRTTGGRGIVATLTVAEIKQFDAGAKFGPEFAGERIPTLDEALDAIEGKAIPDIDFKAGDPAKLVEVLRARGLLGKASLANNDPVILRKVIDCGGGQVLIRPAPPKERDSVGVMQQSLDPPLANIDDPSRFTEIHRAGIKVFTNTMSERQEDEEAHIKAAIEACADYIQTDRLDILVPLLKERGLYAPHP